MDSPIVPTYTLTVEEASGIFSQAGVPCSRRTVNTYCQDQRLECTKDDRRGHWRYLITQESIEVRIAELKRASRDGENQLPPVVTGSNQKPPEVTGSDQNLQALQAENLRLRIEGETKDKMFDRAMQKVFEVGKDVERLETKIKQIEAPII